MTQTIWQMTWDWNWLLETRSRKLLSGSDRKKMSRYNFHTNWMSNCPSCMSSGSRQLEKLDNNKGDEKRESWWLRIKCLLKGEDQYRLGARKTLNLRFGTCIIRGQGQVKGWLWQGRVPETLTWEQRMWTMSNGDRVSVSGGQDGSKWGQSVTTETSGHFLESSVTQCNMSQLWRPVVIIML